MEHLAQLKRRKLRHALEIVRNADATVRQQMDEVQEEGEYELDLDKLSAETLFALHEYVEKHCNPKLKLVVSSPAAAVRNTTPASAALACLVPFSGSDFRASCAQSLGKGGRLPGTGPDGKSCAACRGAHSKHICGRQKPVKLKKSPPPSLEPAFLAGGESDTEEPEQEEEEEEEQEDEEETEGENEPAAAAPPCAACRGDPD